MEDSMVKKSFETLILELRNEVEILTKRVDVLEKKPHLNSVRDGWSVSAMAKEIGLPSNKTAMDFLRVHARSMSKKNGWEVRTNGEDRKTEYFCDPAADYAMNEAKAFFEE